MRICLVLVTLAATSCATAPPPSPFYGDEKYLRFGVDPDQEADAVVEDQRTRGYVVSRKIAGQHFTALGFMEPNGRSAAVRVVTARGIALALDPKPATAFERAVSYALLAQPIPDTHDADKDGFDEVFIERRSDGAQNCIDVYRVRDVGFVDPVSLDARVFDQAFCPNALLDLDDDGTAELLADVALRGFEPLTPHVRVVLWARGHRFELAGNPSGNDRFATAERVERDPPLQQSRARRDADTALQIAIELAAYAKLTGRDPNQQLAELDVAMRGLALSPVQTASVLAARTRIFRDWNAPDSPSGGAADKEAARP